jgi:hypothetical protein
MICSETNEIYGLRFTGLDGGEPPSGARPVPAAESGGDVVAIRHRTRDPEPPGMHAAGAVLDLPEGRQVSLSRQDRTATFSGPPITPDELMHPYLGAVASVFNRWAGREVYHAGAFEWAGRAWAVVGNREAGKSSLLAALAARGIPVVADDLVVTDGRQVFCGPRSVDLRSPLPDMVAPLVPARGDSRWRLSLPAIAPRIELGGFIYLHWAPDVAFHAVSASSSLARVAARRSWPDLPSDLEALLRLATQPGWDLHRPLDWARMDDTVDLMLGSLPTAPSLRPVAPQFAAAWAHGM